MTNTKNLTNEEIKRLTDAYFIVLDKYVIAMNETKSDKIHYDLWNEMVNLLQRFKPIINADKYVIERDISAYNFVVPYSVTYYSSTNEKLLTFDFSN